MDRQDIRKQKPMTPDDGFHLGLRTGEKLTTDAMMSERNQEKKQSRELAIAAIIAAFIGGANSTYYGTRNSLSTILKNPEAIRQSLDGTQDPDELKTQLRARGIDLDDPNTRESLEAIGNFATKMIAGRNETTQQR